MVTQAEIDAVTAKEVSLLQEIRPLAAKVETLEQRISRIEQLTKRANSAASRGETLSPTAQAALAEANADIAALRSELLSTQSVLAPLRAEQGQLATQRVELTKQLAAQPPVAPAESASTSGQPSVAATPVNTSPTNADTTATTNSGGGDSGLNEPTKTLDQTQSTSNQPGVEGSNTFAPTSPGVGANDGNPNPTGVVSEDSRSTQSENSQFTRQGTGTDSVVTGALNTTTRPQIIPQPNVLDKFSSYTYRISVYLMSPTQYFQLVRSKKKNINGYNLLFQSGGAPTNTGGFQGALSTAAQATAQNNADLAAEGIGFQQSAPGVNNSVDAGRNPAFPLDFYIDNCTLTNILQGKGSNSNHSVSTLKFTVIEPVGITLIDRIYEAVQDSAPTENSGRVNYSNAQYLMAIRWYGYDQNGNVISGNPNNSDPRSAVEKLIPFVINKINWKVSAKATEYEFDCTAIGQIIAGGTRRGVIPYDIQLTQGTVGGILGGQKTFTDKSPSTEQPGQSTTATENQSSAETARLQRAGNPPKANNAATSKPTVKQGLMAAMNEFAQELTTGGNPTYEIADQYEIVFAKGAEAIRDATIVLPDSKKDAKQLPMHPRATQTPSSLNPATQSKDISNTSKSIVAGQSIVQIIDQVIRNSSYVLNQALTVYDDQVEKANDNSKAKRKPVDWFRINFEAVPIGDKQDSRRNDYAYKIRYIISAYRIDNYDSKYFPVGSFRGVHKSYPWLFTGKNIAVIDYSEELNSAYNILVSGSDPTNSQAEIERRKIAATMRELVTYTYGPASGETRQGTRGKGNEPSANLADSLTGVGGDLGNTKVTIIGDPSWIQQGSIGTGLSAELFDSNSFLPDGTINFDAEQIMFEVNWSRPSDYNIQTGVADPNSINKPPVSRVYTTSTVVSEFRQGKFTQTLHGVLFQIPKPDGSNKAPTAPMPAKGDVSRENESAAETARLVRQNAAGSRENESAAETARLARQNARVTGQTYSRGAAQLADFNSRQSVKAAAGIGANGGTTSVPAPANPLPVNIQQVNTNGTPLTTNDSVRSAPPPDAPTSGTGELLGVNTTQAQTLAQIQTQRFTRDTTTNELIVPSAGAVTTTQDMSWES
jgi:hypothetical protein